MSSLSVLKLQGHNSISKFLSRKTDSRMTTYSFSLPYHGLAQDARGGKGLNGQVLVKAQHLVLVQSVEGIN